MVCGDGDLGLSSCIRDGMGLATCNEWIGAMDGTALASIYPRQNSSM
jgi:hypothetical protein